LQLSFVLMIAANIQKIKEETGQNITLVAVTKTKPVAVIMQAYEAGQRVFGENKVQEMVDKYNEMPKDIAWHMIGHLQTNKVKYIAPFVSLVHSVDSLKLLDEIEKQGARNKRKIDVLLQVFIAREETKFGLDENELTALLKHIGDHQEQYAHVRVRGLMGMASNTENEEQVRSEFRNLRLLFDRIACPDPIASGSARHDTNRKSQIANAFDILSMGMSSDYKIAVEEGSTMIRVGSLIFGGR
jgi:pyridoxal phosphate enzyme (YggS family)